MSVSAGTRIKKPALRQSKVKVLCIVQSETSTTAFLRSVVCCIYRLRQHNLVVRAPKVDVFCVLWNAVEYGRIQAAVAVAVGNAVEALSERPRACRGGALVPVCSFRPTWVPNEIAVLGDLP